MNKELLNQEVLALYDVRGIQDFIFKTNYAKEIVGASIIVKDIICDGLKEYIKKEVELSKQDLFMVDWEQDDPDAFLNQDDIQMQVMFIGGGNSYVLFRTGVLCERVNRFLAKYILEKTYSLKLAVAVVAKTNNYQKDYENINIRMQEIKAHMPMSMPLGALPFMEIDSITGYPISIKDSMGEYSSESNHKREMFKTLNSTEGGERIFDHMVTEKGDNSTLAVFHIDGNRMGIYIRNEMQCVEEYSSAIKKMRTLSMNIAKRFRDVVDQMKQYLDVLAKSVKSNQSYKLYREIIVAGDDITFVCNAKLAIPAVQYFLEHIGEDEFGFSACGGIAFFNSHFPFSDAYEVAEACCTSAKNVAKASEYLGKNGEVGCFLDFQVCKNKKATNLQMYRRQTYASGNELLIARPYCVVSANNCMKSVDEISISRFNAFLTEVSSYPRNKMKLFRDAISGGEASRKEMISFLHSRGYDTIQKNEAYYKMYYDALEVMDWYLPKLEEEGVDYEN